MRVFTGIPLPGPIAEIARERSRSLDPFDGSIRWVDLHTVHLTLHFFPSLSEVRVDKLRRVTETALSNVPSFSLRLGRPGFFPSLDYPRIFWWGIEASQELIGLHSRLSAVYQEKGYELEERPFKPHFTLGRFADAPVPAFDLGRIERDWALEGCDVPVTQVRLFRSPAGPEGYPAIHDFPLQPKN